MFSKLWNINVQRSNYFENKITKDTNCKEMFMVSVKAMLRVSGILLMWKLLNTAKNNQNNNTTGLCENEFDIVISVRYSKLHVCTFTIPITNSNFYYLKNEIHSWTWKKILCFYVYLCEGKSVTLKCKNSSFEMFF